MKDISELTTKLSDLILSQQTIFTGSASASKGIGQTVAIRLDKKIPGLPTVVRAIALSEIRSGPTGSTTILKLNQPIGTTHFVALSNSPSGVISKEVQTSVSTPQPEAGAFVNIKLLIGAAGATPSTKNTFDKPKESHFS